MEPSKLFWSASLTEMKRGYRHDPAAAAFVCLICGERFEQGRIYPVDDLLLEAERATQTHIGREHSSMFEALLGLDKKYTGLTEHQKELLTCFYQNLSDREIAVRMENGNTSTVRNQRFSFREKAKQAKIVLAIAELLEERSPKAERFIEIPAGVARTDERFAITEAENEAILQAYFKAGPNGPLSGFPKKEKRKIAILRQLIRRFDPGRIYTEKEVNAVLKSAFDDYVTLRRYLIEYGFMDRHPDGSRYWVKN